MERHCNLPDVRIACNGFVILIVPCGFISLWHITGIYLMKLFQKHKRPEDLGAMIYESLREAIVSEGDLSVARLIQSLDKTEAELGDQYHGEVIVGLMFAAVMAIERSATPQVANRIVAGMKAEFLTHLGEQGASEIERAEWEAIIAGRFLEYRHSLENYSGFEPPWKLGREFLWNMIGEKEQIAMSIKIATLYLLAARDASQELLNVHGPTLRVSGGS